MQLLLDTAIEIPISGTEDVSRPSDGSPRDDEESLGLVAKRLMRVDGGGEERGEGARAGKQGKT